jgi:DNA polymerase-3 subunit epsilon
VGFLDHELHKMGASERIAELCGVTDTLVMAKKMHPGQRNSLDALCKRYDIDNSHRELHGALLDSEILADVYLMMTGGQGALNLDSLAGESGSEAAADGIRRLPAGRPRLSVIEASADELASHQKVLEAMGEACLWTKE